MIIQDQKDCQKCVIDMDIVWKQMLRLNWLNQKATKLDKKNWNKLKNQLKIVDFLSAVLSTLRSNYFSNKESWYRNTYKAGVISWLMSSLWIPRHYSWIKSTKTHDKNS